MSPNRDLWGNGRPRQRTPRRVKLVFRPSFVPRCEEFRDAGQRYQKRQAGVLRKDSQEGLLRQGSRQARLLSLGPLEESLDKHARVALAEVSKRADARVPALCEGDDLGVDVRLVPPLGCDMEIGRDVAHGETEGVEPITQIRVGQPVADEGQRNAGGIALPFSQRRQESIDVHRWKLVAEEMATLVNGSRDL